MTSYLKENFPFFDETKYFDIHMQSIGWQNELKFGIVFMLELYCIGIVLYWNCIVWCLLNNFSDSQY